MVKSFTLARPREKDMSKLSLMAVFAHPDDEAFGTGGTLTKYAAEGHDVYLVTATRGEAGEIAQPDLATPANLPLVRERELRCACETTMRVIAFILDPAVIRKILEHRPRPEARAHAPPSG